MRGIRRGLAAAVWCAVLGLAAPAHAEGWADDAERLARQIVDNDLIVTDRVRAAQRQAAAQLTGEAKLQALYDLAADDFVASDADRAAASLAILHVEAESQRSTRYLSMAAMLRAYAPSLDGDYVAARRNLSQALTAESDPFVRAAGYRFLAYTLTDLGLFGNALEAARTGLVRLPDEPITLTLRSGLHDAMSYNAISIGDYDAAIEHLQRGIDLDREAHHPTDGNSAVYNIVTMLGQAGATQASLRLLDAHRQLALRSGADADLFFADLLCAQTNFLARNYARAVQCADSGRAIAAAPPEYLPHLMTYRLHALARLGRGREARGALDHLRASVQARGDPSLSEQLDQIEPEVLFAEGRTQDAFIAMRVIFERAQQNVMTRFNDGVKELRATMENEVAEAEQHAASESMRSELQARRVERLTLLVLLGGVFLIGLGGVGALIYRNQRDMLRAVARAEDILTRRGALPKSGSARQHVLQSHKERLAILLDEIERRDNEQEQTFAQLNAARSEAEAANLAKSHFLATMSHELRTPLNAIIGYSELLIEEGGDAYDDLSHIRTAGKNLLAMINDVLDLSKIESGQMSANLQAVDVALVLRDVVAGASALAEANQNRVTLDADGIGCAETDGRKLSQCLQNLMSNAVKFTQNGEVTLKARRSCEADGEWLTFEVSDTGIGIAPETQERLFRPFVQADASATRSYGGTGLGLAITRSLTQVLGGDVSVRSFLGEGSTFTLRVPAVLPENAEVSEGALEAA